MLEESSASSDHFLPQHIRCAAHTLNLVASVDTKLALEDSVYKKQSRMIDAKLQALWNSQNRSSLTADRIKIKIGRYLPTPVVTRWNSYFDCCVVILEKYSTLKKEFESIFDYVKIQHLKESEIEFLTEYCAVSLFYIFKYNFH